MAARSPTATTGDTRQVHWDELPRWAVLYALTLVALVGCYKVPAGRHAVDEVDVLETSAISEGEILDRIATASSPRFLGIWDGVAFEYEYYDKFVLQRDLARIERLYRARGFYDAKVRASRVIATDDGHVRVEIVVDEGPPVMVEQAMPTGLDKVPFQSQAAVVEGINKGPQPGDRFDEDEYEKAKERIRTSLMDRGYAWAKVDGRVLVNLVSRKATIQYTVESGPHFKIRSVSLRGLGDIPEGPVRRALGLKAGEEFSADKLESGKQALLDLGVFADVDVSWTATPQGTDPVKPEQIPRDDAGYPAVDVTVNVTPAPLHTLKLGFGVELDTIRTDVHGVAGWESRNFIGGLRRFSITAKPGLVFFPTTVPEFQAPSRVLPEAKLRSELRQPGFLEGRTSGVLRGEFAIFPVLLRQQESDVDVILGYRELRGAVGLDRRFFRSHLYLGAFFNLQAYYPFTYLGDLRDEVRTVFIRFVELESNLSFRDSAIRPHSGVFFGNNLQFAGGLFGGNVDDIKVQPDVRFYVPISRTVTFAVRWSVGFLFPRNYSQSLTAEPITEGDTRDQQLLYFRAFFSGGPGSNRGYPYRGVGPHDTVLFLSPNISAQQLERDCNPVFSVPDPARCSVPVGGLSLWEGSAEVRFPLLGPLTGAVFADASDVARRELTLHFEYLHFSTGGGLRYDTPVGPIRVDVGYRVPGLQKVGGELGPKEGDPGDVFGAPIAFSLAVGEAF